MWRALHIFYYDKQDEMLVNGIMPIIKKYNLTQFFFIRYWENGPHIRFRINIDDDKLFKNIENEVEQYIANNPSTAVLSEKAYIASVAVYAEKEKYEVKEPNNLIANNTVCVFEYIPEIMKYHGINGVFIAESEFCFSSTLAFQVIEKNLNKKNQIAFGAAFEFILVNCVLDNESDVLKFLQFYKMYWKNYSRISEAQLSKVEGCVEQLNTEPIKNIAKVFEKNKADVFHIQLFKEISEKIGNDSKIRFDFLMNFIHLFNNRINIVPVEEIETTLICEKIMKEK
ncbi:MAG: hypothetical protein HUJ68_04865 [Clostridia bacterium]|nr:hypothetical protein [Clostridia bacterium]